MTASGVRELARSQRGSLHAETAKLDRRGCGAGLVVRNIERGQGSAEALMKTVEFGDDWAG